MKLVHIERPAGADRIYKVLVQKISPEDFIDNFHIGTIYMHDGVFYYSQEDIQERHLRISVDVLEQITRILKYLQDSYIAF